MKTFLWCLFWMAIPAVYGQGLHFEPMSVNMGQLQQHEKRSTDVTIENAGLKPIRILSIRSNCGCTTASPEKETLAPGESVTLSISFESGYFQGKQEKHVYINTDEPTRYQYFVYADVVMPYELVPPMLMISEPGKTTSHKVVLRDNTQQKDHRLISAGGMAEGLSGRVDDAGDLYLDVDPARFHEKDTTVELNISGVENPVLYRVRMSSESELKVSPRNLLVMGVRSGQPVTRQLRIRDLPESARLLSCTSTVDFLECGESRMVDEDMQISFHAIGDRMKRGYGKGSVTLELELEPGQRKTVTVPVAYNIN